ncbi:MAG: RNA polymerase sigma factor [Pseudomonadales bacterium]|nr:RNA polymerase sigma factor [Pseudomonadales bacterium]
MNDDEPLQHPASSPLLDENAFRALVQCHHARMINTAMAFVANRATAEEVVQETWLAVIEGLPDLENRESLIPWLYRILSNKAQRRGQRDKRMTTFTDLTEAETEDSPEPGSFTRFGFWKDTVPLWDELDPERIFAGQQLWRHLQRAIANLPTLQRAVIALTCVEELDVQDICQLLAITEGNRRVLLHRARSELRRHLDRILQPG